MANDTTPAWDGRPENPERDGWHWLQYADDALEPYFWVSGEWTDGGGFNQPLVSAPRWRYLSPVLTPQEVAAREAAAFAAGAEAMREMAAKREDAYALSLYREDPGIYGAGDELREMISQAESRASFLRALPLPPMPQGGRDAG